MTQEQLRKFKTRIQAIDTRTGKVGYFDGPEVSATSYKEAKDELYKQNQYLEIYAEIIETVELKTELNDPIPVPGFKLPTLNVLKTV